jgi:hypothetical protein
MAKAVVEAAETLPDTGKSKPVYEAFHEPFPYLHPPKLGIFTKNL